jgi:hypothetical protein
VFVRSKLYKYGRRDGMTDRSVLFVFTNAKPGRDDEFNTWYDGIHAETVLSVEGFVGMKRYRFHSGLSGLYPRMWSYIAAYDVVGDPDRAGALLSEKIASVDTSPGPDVEVKDSQAWFYTPISTITSSDFS